MAIIHYLFFFIPRTIKCFSTNIRSSFSSNLVGNNVVNNVVPSCSASRLEDYENNEKETLLPSLKDYYDEKGSFLDSYSFAKDVRTLEGHMFAVPLYKDLLQKNSLDVSAATHIAASYRSLDWQDSVFENVDKKDITKLRRLLEQSNFTAKNIHELFCEANVKQKEKILKCSATGPIYIKPVVAGDIQRHPLRGHSTRGRGPDGGTNTSEDFISHRKRTSLYSLINLFLLGFSVRRDVLNDSLLDGSETVNMLERIGMIHASEQDERLMVPYICLFPLDLSLPMQNNDQGKECWNHVVLATDWHPTVLSTTTVGRCDEGAVMYIGPDSLALVAQWPVILESYQEQTKGDFQCNSDSSDNETINLLDICCGSGIQAIALLKQLEAMGYSCCATVLDINPRCLRFARFNAQLNGIQDNKFHVHCDDITLDRFEIPTPPTTNQDGLFDIIVANPPFIPVPPDNAPNITSDKDDNNSVNDDDPIVSISKRYGLFSSGGPSGKVVLESILKKAPQLLKQHPKRDGMIAIVSEFMNPGDAMTTKIRAWLRVLNLLRHTNTVTGLLVTNQHPLYYKEYASRRAGRNNVKEFGAWINHLELEQIEFVSPGLLFLKCHETKEVSRLNWEGGREIMIRHVLLPRGDQGSIWTPHNFEAVLFVLAKWESLIHFKF